MDLGIVFISIFVHCHFAKTRFSLPIENGNNKKHGNWFILLKEEY